MIFVAIAAYTDPELPRTLRSCIDEARYPDDLRFGICWQGDPAAPVSLDVFREDARFRFSDHTVAESKGGCWARHLAQGMWAGEEFTFQVDSHTRFARHWDARLLRMMEVLPASKPLITGLTPLYFYDHAGVERRQDGGPRNTIVSSWGPPHWAPFFAAGPRTERQPARTRALSGGQVFTVGRWVEEVRQDPEHYYWGEEFALSVRSFTWGYDLFLPQDIVLWHMLHRTVPRRHWEHGNEVRRRHNVVAFERLRKLVYSSGEDLGAFGLGPHRTLAQYELFSGFDLKRKRAHPDVFAGNNPDPVTIRNAKDWDRALSFAAYQRRPLPWLKRNWRKMLRTPMAKSVRRAISRIDERLRS